MNYVGAIIRPPSEAHALIIQVTVGCAHNLCSFCGAYRDQDKREQKIKGKRKKFRIKSREENLTDLKFAKKYCRQQKTVFLADGDAIDIPFTRLVKLLEDIKFHLPWVRRVSSYASSNSILGKDEKQLLELKKLGLSRLYMGLESGDDTVLKEIKKDPDSSEMIKAGKLVRKAGIFLSVTCLLGIAGQDNSIRHGRATARVLCQMEPSQIAILTLMILDNTELAEKAEAGKFIIPSQRQLLQELRVMVDGLVDIRAQFQANHASNYLTLDGRLPRDRQSFLDLIDLSIKGQISLKEERLRAL
jgi:radical SAM superfamily enzyme YgiQ (UPF0313 family)